MPDAIFIKNENEFLRRINVRAKHLGFMRTQMDKALDLQRDNIIDGTKKKQTMIKSKGSRRFPELTPRYKRQKDKHFPDKPILEATGEMLSEKSFVKKIFSMAARTVGRLIYVGPPRGIAHQQGVRKRFGRLRMRAWYGFRTGDPRKIFRSISAGVVRIIRRLRS